MAKQFSQSLNRLLPLTVPCYITEKLLTRIEKTALISLSRKASPNKSFLKIILLKCSCAYCITAKNYINSKNYEVFNEKFIGRLRSGNINSRTV